MLYVKKAKIIIILILSILMIALYIYIFNNLNVNSLILSFIANLIFMIFISLLIRKW